MEGGPSTSVDAPLWFCWSLQQYYLYLKKQRKDAKEFYDKYFAPLEAVLVAFRDGTSFNIGMNETGLIQQGAEGQALTWMDAVIDGIPVTPRRGMTVEINALWFNNISFALELAEAEGNSRFVKEWEPLKERAGSSFKTLFWNSEKGYLADGVENSVANWEIRPNQVIATSMTYSPLESGMKESILSYVRNFLLTPRGLRTLAADEEHYIGLYEGDQKSRDRAYHQGTVWPWLLSHYCEGLIKCMGSDALKEVEDIYSGFEEEMWLEGIGTVSEIYEGNLPSRAAGAVSQAWSVSELLRMRYMLKTEGKKK